MTPYREGLPPRPPRIAALPLDARGYPIPWFVAIVGGIPDFRVADARKLVRAIKENRCWICGQPLGQFKAVPVGPLGVINRISAEAPCHRDCAEYALVVCPFLLNPSARRREADLPDDIGHAGHLVPDNPGVMALWVAREFPVLHPPGGGVLFGLRTPAEVIWWTQGRLATRGEVAVASVESVDRARRATPEDLDGLLALDARAEKSKALWPADPAPPGWKINNSDWPKGEGEHLVRAEEED